jgi:hypothetical protein
MQRLTVGLVLTVTLLVTAWPLLAAPAPLNSSPIVTAPETTRSTLGDVAKLLAYGVAVFGAIKVKDAGTLAAKYAARAGAATKEYTDGVAQAGGDWEAGARAAEGSYEQGVQAAIGRKAFGKGIGAAGAAKYQARAVQLGGQRYGPGVQVGKDAWAQQTAPYLQKIASLALPPRGPRRSPANQARANMVASELGKMKEERA